MDPEIQSYRSEIDAIDRRLLELLNARAQVALRIAARKRATGLPVVDPSREREVLSRARRANPGPLTGPAVDRLFTSVIRESRILQGQLLSRRLESPMMEGTR